MAIALACSALGTTILALFLGALLMLLEDLLELLLDCHCLPYLLYGNGWEGRLEHPVDSYIHFRFLRLDPHFFHLVSHEVIG